jgi:hypothetical protein
LSFGVGLRGHLVGAAFGVAAEDRGQWSPRRGGWVRPYPGLGELWRMVARSAYAQLRHNSLLLVGTVVGLVFVYLAPPVAL